MTLGISLGYDAAMTSAYPRRAPRVRVLPLHHLVFRPQDSALGPTVALSNISPTGVALLGSSNPQGLRRLTEPGEVLLGQLVFNHAAASGGIPVPVSLRVAHASAGVVGAAFVDSPKPLQDAILRYFDLEFSALAMTLVNPKFHKREADGDSHWIHGDNSELYYVESGGTLLRFRLSFLGNQVEGARGQGVTGGQIVADQDPGKISVKGSTVVRMDEQLSPALRHAARRFVTGIPHLPGEHLRAILELLG
jgi:hypothetical protein